jgi:hypothetical protein
MKDKRNKYKTLVAELYGYIPYCKHTILEYRAWIFTHFKDRKDALKYIDRNLEE